MWIVFPRPKDDPICDLTKVMEESLKVVELRHGVSSSNPDLMPLSAALVSMSLQITGVSYFEIALLFGVFPSMCTLAHSQVSSCQAMLVSISHTFSS